MELFGDRAPVSQFLFVPGAVAGGAERNFFAMAVRARDAAAKFASSFACATRDEPGAIALDTGGVFAGSFAGCATDFAAGLALGAVEIATAAANGAGGDAELAAGGTGTVAGMTVAGDSDFARPFANGTGLLALDAFGVRAFYFAFAVARDAAEEAEAIARGADIAGGGLERGPLAYGQFL